MENVKDPLDLRADDDGVWIHKSVYSILMVEVLKYLVGKPSMKM